MAQYTPGQIKYRYKALKYVRDKNHEETFNDSKSSDSIKDRCRRGVVDCNVASKSEKMHRISVALKMTTQRHYFDGTFFERLPEEVFIN